MTADALIEAVARELHHAGWERDYWTDCARKVIAAIEANGFRVVPVEPTAIMIRHGQHMSTAARYFSPMELTELYAAMLSAAPKLTEPKE